MTWKEFEKLTKNLEPTVGMWDVGIIDITDENEYSTQGDIPDEDYTWRDFYEWLEEDCKEMDLVIENIRVDYVEYAGELDY